MESNTTKKVTLGDLKRQHRALMRAHNKELAKKARMERLIKDISYLHDRVHALKMENKETQESLYNKGLTHTLNGVLAREWETRES